MLAPGVLGVLASATTLLTLSLAQEFCNTATIGNFGKEDTETVNVKQYVIPGTKILWIKDRCPYWAKLLTPEGMRVTACDRDAYPQVHLRGLDGEVHRLGDIRKRGSVTVQLSCLRSTDSEEFIEV